MNKKPSSKGKINQPRLVRGMKDILPSESNYWEHIRKVTERLAQDHGFSFAATPILEDKNLFVRSIGETTDIVEKEMFSFVDQGGDTLVLRPENTASIVRAYIEHGWVNLPQPVKVWYWGSMFRRERPQAGRYREFHQFGFETLGDGQPVNDAQLIMLAYNFFLDLKLDVSLQINSLGTKESREKYKKVLAEYYKSHKRKLCDDCKKRLLKNPLRLLDCKEEQCAELAIDAPQIIDYLSEEDTHHFTQVLEYLDELELPYSLNPRIMRGLDYYSRTAFEIWPNEEPGARQSALGGGGRYDGLAELLGGRPTPAAGFAVGIERVIALLRERQVYIPGPDTPDIFLAQLGDASRRRALKLFDELRLAGFTVAESFSKDSIKQQLEVANRLNISITLILGQKEIIDGTILFRDMESGTQEVVNYDKVIQELSKRIDKVRNHNDIKITRSENPIPREDENNE
ncbi:MAG: histidine--tRNA ligase [bacterium]|nr:histidine--tRNA ligase [bacterium]